MTDASAAAVAAMSAARGDERLAYRGVFQRLFIRPEIGALLGAVGIWLFFWAVAIPFGTANGAAGILDYAATLGIMAVAVSMLMIGGEFDLSSGANTGAMGMLIILLVKETGDMGGAGLPYVVAIPLSFAVAMAIGFFNGWMVEKTALPSFIITLATFFVLKGAKLGFAKLIVDQIQVGRADEGAGYEFFRKIFAGEWDRTQHVWEARDAVYLVGVLGGIALITLAVHEMHFERRAAGLKPSGLVQFVIGLAVTIAGIAVLHLTDDITGNWLGAAVIAVGAAVALHGFSSWRFEPAGERGNLMLTAPVVKFAGLGVAALIGFVISSLAWDANDTSAFIFPWTKQGFRATLMLVFGLTGYTFLLMAVAHAKRTSLTTRAAITMLISVATVALAFFIRSQSTSVKFRTEAFSVMLGIALIVAIWAILGVLFAERQRTNSAADHLGGRLVTIGVVAAAIGFVVKLLFTVQAEIDAGIPPVKFSMRIVWFIAFTAVLTWVLGRTRFGSWTFAVGGNKEASRQVGVPAARTKTQLFMLVAGAAWLVGILLAFRLNTIQASTGDGEEFDYIIAAVVGGTLLTGGYGSAFGGSIGAIIVAMATLGIPFARWNSDWRFLFLGVILLLAVIANRSIRARAEGLRR
jgi:ribose/xylose/arabinose/galactoside ABC-type transport system permease subunit